jgi:hypothetical protein
MTSQVVDFRTGHNSTANHLGNVLVGLNKSQDRKNEGREMFTACSLPCGKHCFDILVKGYFVTVIASVTWPKAILSCRTAHGHCERSEAICLLGAKGLFLGAFLSEAVL